MTQYDRTFAFPVAFPPQSLSGSFAEVMAAQHLTNLRVAETEKYPHVSYFFNCGIEKPYPGEDRILVPSPKVPTYDLQPEMSAKGITDTLVSDVESRKHDVIICNFANADMVGHTGNLEAAVKAVETIDHCLGRIVRAVRDAGGIADRDSRITATPRRCGTRSSMSRTQRTRATRFRSLSSRM